jgi:hypothetical protein
LGAIITAPSLLDVDALLEEAGIIELEGVERPSDDSSERLTPPPSLLEPVQLQHQASSNVAPGYSSRSLSLELDSHNNGFATPATSTSSTPPALQESPSQYNQLLDFIINTAGEIRSLPRQGATISTSASPRPEFDVSLALYSHIQGEREFKTGAAGELFVSIRNMTQLEDTD